MNALMTADKLMNHSKINTIIKTYTSTYKRKIASANTVDREDLEQDALVTLLECRAKYNGSRGNFIGYFAAALRNNLSSIMHKYVKDFILMNLDAPSIMDGVSFPQGTINRQVLNQLTYDEMFVSINFKELETDEENLLKAILMVSSNKTSDVIDFLNKNTKRKWSNAKVCVIKKTLREKLKDGV